MQELVISKFENKKIIALTKDGKLIEIYNEDEAKKRLEGNIYIGIVKDVLVGMQAAFVDIGEEKNAFIHIKDIIPKTSNITGNKNEDIENYNIKDYIKQGDKILVQVKKDSISTKGARITTHINIPGRFIVLLPENEFVTVSQKIEDEEEKNRLIQIVENLDNKEKIGMIIRTAADGKTKEQIEQDITQTIKKWKNIREKYNLYNDSDPCILQENDTILQKILLDTIDCKIEKIWVDNNEIQDKVNQILNSIDQNNKIKVEFQEKNLLNRYDIDNQIEKLQNRKIWLNCGGFITIDKTEALTAIDVNSGKFTGKESLEQTVLKVNKEASVEIAKQLRLRDIGGIIVIDYIDMKEDKSRNEVIEVLRESLKEDRSKTQIMEFTKLNLLEITRKHMFSE